jgi:hypothetical protein
MLSAVKSSHSMECRDGDSSPPPIHQSHSCQRMPSRKKRAGNIGRKMGCYIWNDCLCFETASAPVVLAILDLAVRDDHNPVLFPIKHFTSSCHFITSYQSNNNTPYGGHFLFHASNAAFQFNRRCSRFTLHSGCFATQRGHSSPRSGASSIRSTLTSILRSTAPIPMSQGLPSV